MISELTLSLFVSMPFDYSVTLLHVIPSVDSLHHCHLVLLLHVIDYFATPEYLSFPHESTLLLCRIQLAARIPLHVFASCGVEHDCPIGVDILVPQVTA